MTSSRCVEVALAGGASTAGTYGRKGVPMSMVTTYRRAALGCAGVVVVCLAGSGSVLRAAPSVAAGQSPAQESRPAVPATRVFASDAGLVLNFIKPDKTADFEAVMAKLKAALEKSAKPERRQQAAGWKIFRALEPGANGSVLYVFTIDPAVPGADYTVSTILAEGFPDEVQALYAQYAGAYAAGQNVVNLKLSAALGQ
jgi:hypothetical protein